MITKPTYGLSLSQPSNVQKDNRQTATVIPSEQSSSFPQLTRPRSKSQRSGLQNLKLFWQSVCRKTQRSDLQLPSFFSLTRSLSTPPPESSSRTSWTTASTLSTKGETKSRKMTKNRKQIMRKKWQQGTVIQPRLQLKVLLRAQLCSRAPSFTVPMTQPQLLICPPMRPLLSPLPRTLQPLSSSTPVVAAGQASSKSQALPASTSTQPSSPQPP
mmetsp:Transcript_30803/g.60104  ORF Transcript_30803/g.60104 Transcript_30803/m.60104 type:complete len:214 (+) Transcript_30803:601-1242(+)